MAAEPISSPAPILRLPPVNDASLHEEISLRADTVSTRVEVKKVRAVGKKALTGKHGRVAIVDGARTPFAKAGTVLKEMDVVDLAGVALAELVAKTAVDPDSIDLSIFGVVIPSLAAPNLGREAAFRASLPFTAQGTTVNLACASGNRAIAFGAQAILSGEAEVVVAGGAESLSNVPITFGKSAAEKFMRLSKARGLGQKVGVAGQFRPADFAPVAPAIAEYSTGQTMGQSAEKMAKENDISRRAQDELALLSHRRAAVATAEGRFASQIAPTFPPPRHDQAVTTDNGVRGDTSYEALSQLKPVFDRRYGTLTAGNSSPITDGASAVLLMSEERAKALGYTPLGYLRSWAVAALDPAGQLLQGPAFAAPAALDAAGVKLADLDLIEIHEAFAAQTISTLKALASKQFGEEALGRSGAVGAVDLEKVNVNGGSIAIGHPFGATGGRVVLQLLSELGRRGLQLGMVTVCAAGGHGFAMVLERD
ncbi:MAG TPA: acetyl-CoA C-acyltransferase [Thermoanaerobaculia bacterium]|nr:acetyl-CoA C-acyltransferase [Thermoanaerobaculia bacterium]